MLKELATITNNHYGDCTLTVHNSDIDLFAQNIKSKIMEQRKAFSPDSNVKKLMLVPKKNKNSKITKMDDTYI